MFEVDCHAVSDVGVGNHVSQDRFFIADVSPTSEAPPTRYSYRNGAHREPNRVDASVRGVKTPQRHDPRRSSKMFGIAHGVQGLPAGERASEIVVETAREFVTKNLHNRAEWKPEVLSCALTAVPGRCALALSEDVARNPWERGLGSTLTLAQVVWPRLYLMHLGDCRCYLWRDSRIEQLTADQIVDGTLAERGVVSDESRSLRRRTLWSFIGDGGRNLSPQVSDTELRIGDTLVLCTQGLVQGVSDHRIAELLDNDISAEEACGRLVEAAHDVGGIEDMTVIVVRFRDQRSSIDVGREINSAMANEDADSEEGMSDYWIDGRQSAFALPTYAK